MQTTGIVGFVAFACACIVASVAIYGCGGSADICTSKTGQQPNSCTFMCGDVWVIYDHVLSNNSCCSAVTEYVQHSDMCGGSGPSDIQTCALVDKCKDCKWSSTRIEKAFLWAALACAPEIWEEKHLPARLKTVHSILDGVSKSDNSKWTSWQFWIAGIVTMVIGAITLVITFFKKIAEIRDNIQDIRDGSTTLVQSLSQWKKRRAKQCMLWKSITHDPSGGSVAEENRHLLALYCMPGGAPEVTVQQFKSKAESLNFFDYLISDGLSMDWLASNIDSDKDGRISRSEFFDFYERLDKFRPDANNENVQMYTILVGEEGVGKSTLLNSLLRETRFDAGVREPGDLRGRTGMVIEKDQVNHTRCPRSTLLNIPGWVGRDDSTAKLIKDYTAEAITNNRGFFKLIFVVTQENRQISLLAKRIIMETLDISPSLLYNYGIIVNKCPHNFIASMQDPQTFKDWIAGAFHIEGARKYPLPQEVHLFPRNEAAEDNDNFLLPADHTHKLLQSFVFRIHCNDMRSQRPVHRSAEVLAQGEEYERRRKEERDARREKKRKADAALAADEERRKRQKTSDESHSGSWCIVS